MPKCVSTKFNFRSTSCIRRMWLKMYAPFALNRKANTHSVVVMSIPPAWTNSLPLETAQAHYDEVERRGIAPTQIEAALSQSSIPSLAQRSCDPRSLQPVVRFLYRDLERRSAMRVCQPGPVAFQRS